MPRAAAARPIATQAERAGCETHISRNPESRSDRRLLRDEGRRSVPVARGRECPGDGRLGGGAEPRRVRLPREDPVSPEAFFAAASALQLPEVLRPHAPPRSVRVLEERRPAEPERLVYPEGTRRDAGGPARPEHVLRRRDVAAGSLFAVKGWHVSRLRHLARRIG